MSKEQNLKKRALELYNLHEDWCMRKALAAAIKESNLKAKQEKKGKISIRQIGWLEYWD
jgi:hypothetical protein